MSIALTNGIGDFYFQVGARPDVCCFTRLPCTARPTVSLGKTQIGYWISRMRERERKLLGASPLGPREDAFLVHLCDLLKHNY